MRFADSIVLRDVEYERMPDGAQRPRVRHRRVFCNRLAVGESARLACAAEGLRGAVRVRVRSAEYRGEGFAVWEGREMTVEGASSSGEFTTLTIAERLGSDQREPAVPPPEEPDAPNQEPGEEDGE